jgi:hypothetical protein
VPGPKGAADRKTLIEHYAGKPQQAVDLSIEDGSLPSVWDMVMSMNSEQRAAKLAEPTPLPLPQAHDAYLTYRPTCWRSRFVCKRRWEACAISSADTPRSRTVHLALLLKR